MYYDMKIKSIEQDHSCKATCTCINIFILTQKQRPSLPTKQGTLNLYRKAPQV
jgi:hypothetical protein